MTDETRPDGPGTEGAPHAEGGTTVATPPEEKPREKPEEKPEGKKAEAPAKLTQNVEIRDVGPCRKHIKVTIDRKDIDARLGDHFKKLVAESNVAGFRPGKAPRALVERRFQKEVGD